MDKRIRFSLLTIWYATGLLLWQTTISCYEDTALQNTPIQGSFETTAIAGADQQVVYISEGSPFSVEVISIEDSRCPSDVVCVWAGEVRVTFSISETDQPIDLYLVMGSPCKACSYKFVFEGRLYALKLEDVTPYPTSKNINISRKAHFSVHAL